MTQKLDSAAMTQYLCERLVRLKPDSPRKWGKMTPHGMVCHLVDSFSAVAGAREVSPKMNLFTRTVMKWGALHLPIQWPPGAMTRPEIAQEFGGTQPTDWTADCAALQRRIVHFPGQTSFVSHPFFGKMSLNEWRIWGYRHVDHHFRQFGV
jgi:hypothetical protein